MNVIKTRTLRDRFRDAYNAFRGKKIGSLQFGIDVKRCNKCERNAEVLYLCDKKSCGDNCPDLIYCKHTNDVRYAKNFEKIGDYYWEKEVADDEVASGSVET